MKINGIDNNIKTIKVEEIIKSGALTHVTFNSLSYPKEYRDLVFALNAKKNKNIIKEQFIKEISNFVNLAPGVIETITKIDAEELVSLNYFEVFDLTLKNVYKTTNTTHNVYKTVGVEVKTTTNSNGQVSSTTTPIKEYSHSYTSSKDEIMHKKYTGVFPGVSAHSFLKKGSMYSLPKEVDIKDLVSFDKVNNLKIVRISQPMPKPISVYELNGKNEDLIKTIHDLYIPQVVYHKLTDATHIENIMINKIVLHPIWQVKFEFMINGKKEVFISFISDCDDSFTSAEYLDIPLIKKEISSIHCNLSIANTIIMGFSLIVGLISLWYSFSKFKAEISLPYIILYSTLLYLTINVAIVGFRTELQNPLYYTYYKDNLPEMYLKMVIGVFVLIVLFIFGIKFF